MAWQYAIPAAIQLGSSILGGNAAQGQRDDASRILQGLIQEYQNLSVPDIEKLKVYLEEYQSQGSLSPESIANVGSLAASALESVDTVDPRLRQVSEDALTSYQQIAKDGMSAIDKAQLEQMLRKSAAQEQANTQSIIENRARRGMAGSGDELAAALSGTQSSANRRSEEALQIAAESARRREDALARSSGLAQNLESTDYSRKSSLADKRDSISEYNARLRQNLEQSNVGNRNTAQQFNLENKQRLAEANVNQRNKQQTDQKQLIQDEYDNKLKRLAGMSGAAFPAAKQLSDNATATSNMYNQIGTTGAALTGRFLNKAKE